MAEPKNGQTQNGTARVDQDIPNRRMSGGNKSLMDFITQTIRGREEKSPTGAAPAPAMDLLPGAFPQSIAQQDGQNGVLQQVGAFSYDEIGLLNFVVGEVGFKPAQDRNENAGAMLGRAYTGGHVENEDHPNHHHQPVFKKKFQVGL